MVLSGRLIHAFHTKCCSVLAALLSLRWDCGCVGGSLYVISDENTCLADSHSSRASQTIERVFASGLLSWVSRTGADKVLSPWRSFLHNCSGDKKTFNTFADRRCCHARFVIKIRRFEAKNVSYITLTLRRHFSPPFGFFRLPASRKNFPLAMESARECPDVLLLCKKGWALGTLFTVTLFAYRFFFYFNSF